MAERLASKQTYQVEVQDLEERIDQLERRVLALEASGQLAERASEPAAVVEV
jgi:polyhydroxyalkanoate synthesis regulator phasin